VQLSLRVHQDFLVGHAAILTFLGVAPTRLDFLDHIWIVQIEGRAPRVVRLPELRLITESVDARQARGRLRLLLTHILVIVVHSRPLRNRQRRGVTVSALAFAGSATLTVARGYGR